MNFADRLRDKLVQEVFTQEDVWITFNSHSKQAVHSGISRSLKSNDIVKIKRGLYAFGKRLRRSGASKFVIANNLYNPSYVSFESALSFHGLIPEAVYVTTSACHRRKKKQFDTPFGEFTFDFVPCSPFFMGVKQLGGKNKALIANPIKALFDLLYMKKKQLDSLKSLEYDLRIDLEALQEQVNRYTVGELEILAESYRKRNIRRLFDILIRTMK